MIIDMNDLLKKLNEEQLSAVTLTEGPVLVVAGAGTGKTTVLTQKLAYILEKGLATADEVLITTFTEKATAEMVERADVVLPYGYVDLWINTFHSFCERILRDHALDIGLAGDFKLLSSTDQWMLVRRNLDEFNLNYYRPLGNPTKFIHELLRHFSRLKDENISPADYLKYAEGLCLDKNGIPNQVERGDDEMEISRINELANAYHVYNKLLLDSGSLDFGDLIFYTLKLFKDRPNILRAYQEKFKYIMVDEFQDTNWAQYELIKMLSRPRNNLTVVGDDDQSIYRFRGASMSNIMQFKDDYPSAREVVLVKNYRSGQEILDHAYKFISCNNPNRLEIKLKLNKKLISGKDGASSVEHWHFPTEQAETNGIVDTIANIYQAEKKVDWSDFAILVRANDTADKFIAELNNRGIPNQFVSLKGLYYKPIIMDALAYFRLLDNYHESSAVFRVLSMPIFSVSHADIVEINKFARRKVISTFETLKKIQAVPDISQETIANVNKLLSLVEKHSIAIQKEKVSKIFVRFIYDSGLLKSFDPDRDQEIYSYLNQFYQKIKALEEAESISIRDFIEIMRMEMESGETGSMRQMADDADRVRVMTVHAAKGLEFKYAFIPNLVDKKFPTIGRGEKISIPNDLIKEHLPEGDTHIEEERRLFYVAMTRAKDKLILTSAADYGGAREKKISKFVDEAGVAVKQIGEIKRDELELVKDMNNLDIEIDMPIKYELPKQFSFSQVEAFSNCPLQYKYNFILKIPVEDKVNFIFGRLMHNVLRDFLAFSLAKNGIQPGLFGDIDEKKNKKPALKDLIKLYDAHWVNDGYRSQKERQEYKEKGKKILQTFFENLERDGWPEVMFIEKSFSVKIGESSLRGAIDRIDRLADGTVEIIDYKTGAPKDKLDFDTKKQLMLYQIAVEEVFGLKVSSLAFYYLENGTKLSFVAKQADIEKLQANIIEQINEIKKCQFNPKPGFLCAYCDFKSICEAGG